MRRLSPEDIEISLKTTSKGNQGKYHIKRDDTDDWIKLDYLGYEGASEYICSKLLEHSNIENFVSYSADKIIVPTKTGDRGKSGCISKNFLPEGAELISLHKLLLWNNTTFEKEVAGKSTKDAIKHIVDFIEAETGLTGVGQYLTKMFEFDAYTLNEDRHVQNIAFICQDWKYSFAPIFDNGASFLSDITQEYPLEENAKLLTDFVKAKPFSSSFKKQIEACHELYGKQLEIEKLPLENYLINLNHLYSKKILDRISYLYDLQNMRYKDLLNIKETKELSLAEQYFEELKNYASSGGTLIEFEMSAKYKKRFAFLLEDEEIPFVILPETDKIKIIIRDFDERDFNKVANKVPMERKEYTAKQKVDVDISEIEDLYEKE